MISPVISEPGFSCVHVSLSLWQVSGKDFERAGNYLNLQRFCIIDFPVDHYLLEGEVKTVPFQPP
jgi:hypothetical protein